MRITGTLSVYTTLYPTSKYQCIRVEILVYQISEWVPESRSLLDSTSVLNNTTESMLFVLPVVIEAAKLSCDGSEGVSYAGAPRYMAKAMSAYVMFNATDA